MTSNNVSNFFQYFQAQNSTQSTSISNQKTNFPAQKNCSTNQNYNHQSTNNYTQNNYIYYNYHSNNNFYHSSNFQQKSNQEQQEHLNLLLADYHEKIETVYKIDEYIRQKRQDLAKTLYPDEKEISKSKTNYRNLLAQKNNYHQNYFHNNLPNKKYDREDNNNQLDLLNTLDDFTKYVSLAELYNLPGNCSQNPENRLLHEISQSSKASSDNNNSKKTSFDRFNQINNDYPRMHKLCKMKQYAIEDSNHPSMSLKIDPLKSQDFSKIVELDLKFDALHVNPPKTVDVKELFKVDLRSLVPKNESFIRSNPHVEIDKVPNGRAVLFLWCHKYRVFLEKEI